MTALAHAPGAPRVAARSLQPLCQRWASALALERGWWQLRSARPHLAAVLHMSSMATIDLIIQLGSCVIVAFGGSMSLHALTLDSVCVCRLPLPVRRREVSHQVSVVCVCSKLRLSFSLSLSRLSLCLSVSSCASGCWYDTLEGYSARLCV